jgi:hypothetical protein
MAPLRKPMALLAFAPMAAAISTTPSAEPSVPLALHEVLWIDEDTRVLLFTDGWEHVLSSVRVQWLSARNSAGDRKVLADESVDSIGMSSCSELRRTSATSFQVSCTEVHGSNVGANTTYSVVIRGVGKLTTKAAASSDVRRTRSR